MRYNDVVNNINKRYVNISERLTKAYEKKFGLPCDLYFPIRPLYNEYTKYRDVKIFSPHQSYEYNELPDAQTHFYIPHLIKKQAMNSSELEFDSFYTEEDAIDRPFIETYKKRELPIGTKVVVYQGESRMKFMVDKKLVVTGANGFMLLRMYLDPLAKDSDEDNITEWTVEQVDDYDEEDPGCHCHEEEEEPVDPNDHFDPDNYNPDDYEELDGEEDSADTDESLKYTNPFENNEGTEVTMYIPDEDEE